MVCDIGGGTTEVAVLSLATPWPPNPSAPAVTGWTRRSSITCAVTTACGSDCAAERLKIDVGSAYPLEEERAVELSGVDTISGLPRRATVTSEEIRQALGDPLQEILECHQGRARPLQPRPGRRSGP